MPHSSAVSVGDDATAAQYNDVRNDALGLITSANAGENLTIRQAVYLATDGAWYKADKASDLKVLVRGIVVATIGSGNPVSIQTRGEMSGFSGFTVGATVYLGSGGAVGTALPGFNDTSVIIGFAKTGAILVIQVREPISLGQPM
jgi:hypothetical protein